MAAGTCERCGGRTLKSRRICTRCGGDHSEIRSVEDFGGRLFATQGETALLFGCEPGRVRKMISAGQIPAVQIGERDAVPVWWLRGVAAGSVEIPAPAERPLTPHEAWRSIKFGAVRAKVFAAYGEVCVCCGTSEGLQMDRIDGDVSAHGGHRSGVWFYQWLIDNDFPDGWQVLCGPCNFSKGTGTACRLDHDLRRLNGIDPQPTELRRLR
jgi:hypothetical protein